MLYVFVRDVGKLRYRAPIADPSWNTSLLSWVYAPRDVRPATPGFPPFGDSIF
jgi:hypothetical protein